MNKRKKRMIFGLPLLMVFLALVVVSCSPEVGTATPQEDPEIANKNLVAVSLEAAEIKALNVTIPDQVAKYQYRAIPLFTVEGEAQGTIFGSQLTWRDITVTDTLASLGYFRQGYWRFELRTLNARNQVLAQGSTAENTPPNVYLQKGKNNVVRITLKVSDGGGQSGGNLNTGKIQFAFETNMLYPSMEKAYMRIEADKLSSEDGSIAIPNINSGTGFPLKGNAWTMIGENTSDTGILKDVLGNRTGDGRVRFYAETPDLVPETQSIMYEGTMQDIEVFTGGITPGAYLVRILFCVKDDANVERVVAGQLVGLKVIGGETTVVRGTLVPEKYIETSLSIIVPEEVTGTLVDSNEASPFIVRTDALSGSSVVLTYTPGAALGTDLNYQWRLNGDIIAGANSASYTFVPDRYGDAKITCLVSGKSGSTSYFGEMASAQAVIRVMPATGPNL